MPPAPRYPLPAQLTALGVPRRGRPAEPVPGGQAAGTVREDPVRPAVVAGVVRPRRVGVVPSRAGASQEWAERHGCATGPTRTTTGVTQGQQSVTSACDSRRRNWPTGGVRSGSASVAGSAPVRASNRQVPATETTPKRPRRKRGTGVPVACRQVVRRRHPPAADRPAVRRPARRRRHRAGLWCAGTRPAGPSPSRQAAGLRGGRAADRVRVQPAGQPRRWRRVSVLPLGPTVPEVAGPGCPGHWGAATFPVRISTARL